MQRESLSWLERTRWHIKYLSPIIMAHALKRPISFLRVTLSVDPLWFPPESNIFCCFVFAQFLRFVSVPSICAAVQENCICIRARSHIARWWRTQGAHACAEPLLPASIEINRSCCALLARVHLHHTRTKSETPVRHCCTPISQHSVSSCIGVNLWLAVCGSVTV